MITSILRDTRSDSLAFVTRGEKKNSLGIEDKGISKVTKLEIKEEINGTIGYRVTHANESTSR
jgi:hypothetical protein